jgi:translation initiation factor eIF-2B subunit delta
MLAKENRIPVVAACETYKFGERVLLDAVTGNELGELCECSITSITFLTC